MEVSQALVVECLRFSRCRGNPIVCAADALSKRQGTSKQIIWNGWNPVRLVNALRCDGNREEEGGRQPPGLSHRGFQSPPAALNTKAAKRTKCRCLRDRRG